METPLQIDFQGTQPSPALRANIERQVAGLEDRFGRITSCRVVLKAPGGHHRIGLFEINIHMALPDGRHVEISRTPQADERHANVEFAINDAFKRARRKLQDRVRRMQGQVKVSERPPTGTVVRLGDEFGFLGAEDGHEVYFHRNSVLNDVFSRLKIGDRVTFVEVAGDKGPQASTVKLLGKHGLR
jgi:cold shock CspA family protein/ribosome-associated translation inhibitor RaiA